MNNEQYPIPIYQTIDEMDSVPFGLPRPRRRSLLNNLRCEELTFIPHAHVTHLETEEHLNSEEPKDGLSLKWNEPLLTKIINENEHGEHLAQDENVQFIILRKRNPKNSEFEGFPLKQLNEIIQKYPKLKLIGINEPSFDPESDGGAMLSHEMAFYHGMKLVELINLSKVEDTSCFYHCLLNIFRFTEKTDAYPCSPILYKADNPCKRKCHGL